MPFNPIAKSVKDIQEAYQNGEIDKDAVLAIYQERLNRPGKGKGWKKRYENAISALIKIDDLLNASDAGQNSGTTTTPVNPEVSVQTRDPSSFRLGEIHENVLLESFLTSR